MKRIFTLFLLVVTGLLAHGQANHLVISQVYGGGGNSAATYNRDFVEIFNPHSAIINTGGYSIQYASATGTTWQKFDLPAYDLQPGQYFLVWLASGGANGDPLPDADATGNINMSGSQGKVALVNGTTVLSGTQCPTMNAAIVDYIGFGAANCSESSTAPGASNNQSSIIRADGGCTDTDNNSADFATGPVSPRNTSSTLSPCGAPTASLFTAPGVLNLTSVAGTPSASSSYQLSGELLNGTSILVTAGSGLEVSLDNVSFFSTRTVTYVGSTLDPTTIYVRISASAPQGALNSTVTNVGGGDDATVTVSGAVTRNYYSKSGGTLEALSTWGTNPDGSGASPSDFVSDYQLFNIVNRADAIIAGSWDVSGTGSRIIIGDGVNPTNFTIPSMFEVSSTSRVDVRANSTLTIENNTRPFLNNLEDNSTVDYAQIGTGSTDTIRPAAISYYNLRLSNGLKYLAGGTTTVRGNFTTDNVMSFNGNSGPFSTLNVFGDVTFTNTVFEDDITGDQGRITLALNSTTGTQNLNGNSVARLFRVRRDSVNYSVNINMDENLALVLGNSSSGGLQLNQGASTTTILNTGATIIQIKGGAFITSNAMGRINANQTNFEILKDVGSSNPGILRTTPGSVIADLTLDLGPAVTRDTFEIAENLSISGTFTLNNGKLVIAPGKILEFQPSSFINGGSVSAFIDGRIRATITPGSYIPVGKGTKYAPLEFPNVSAPFTAEIQYFNSGYGITTIDPATLALFPDYRVSTAEYWLVNSTDATTADIIFYYNEGTMGNPAQLRMARFDGTDWNDLAGLTDGTNTSSSGNVMVSSVTAFGPFTFGATTAGVLPVTLKNFIAQKQGSSVKLAWTTATEINTSHFVVEGSVNGSDWREVAVINAAGNSTSERNYSAFDNTPARGLNYYRLRIVDLDADQSYSATRTVNMISSAEIVIAPNPASEEIRISLMNRVSDKVTIRVADATGRIINKVETTNDLVRMNIGKFTSGLYFVTVIDGDNKSTYQFIKN